MWKQRNFIFLLIGVLLIQDSVLLSIDTATSIEEDTQQLLQEPEILELEQFSTQVKEKKGKTEKPENENGTDPCLQEKKVGRCKAAVPRVFFNKANGKCERFNFGGCGGNGNNFPSIAECETVCSKHLSIVSILPVPQEEKAEGICKLPPVNPSQVTCLGYMVRWTYNASEERCVEYIYGGCGASQNNFRNKVACEATCGSGNASSSLDVGAAIATTTVMNTNDADICKLPKDVGVCYALKQRFFFNKRNNRCEVFHFGGCGGNANNFRTVDECVRTCGGDLPSEDMECSDVECPWELYSHYATFNCKPIYDGDACCPTRFDCPDKTQEQLNNTLGEARSLNTVGESSSPQCHYKGKIYPVGAEVPEASDTGSCRAACICSETMDGKAKINCAAIECAEHFGVRPGGRNCVPLYKKGSCCAYDFFCPNDTLVILDPEDQTPQIAEPLVKCNIDGESFYAGQRFYPKQSKCSKCICGVGFNGTLSEDFCEQIDCGIEIYYSDYLEKGCAPVYYQSSDGSTSCCPISWECPTAETDEETRPTPRTPPSPPPPVTETSGIGPVPVTPRTPATEPPLEVPTPSVIEIFIPPASPTGTRNATSTSSHLTQVTQEACELPKEIGNCRGHRTRYFYKKGVNACEEFVYTGCGGNDNNFVSIRDCQRLCVSANASSATVEDEDSERPLVRTLDANRAAAAQPRAIYVTEVDPCTQAKKTGNCKGFFKRFFYSPQEDSCQGFVFGGCNGNQNNFYSKDACEAACTNSLSVQNLRATVSGSGRRTGSGGDASMVMFGEDSTTANFCTQEKKIGPCKAYVTRYYYDVVEKKCKDFGFGGCRPNRNNFKSMKECEKACPLIGNEEGPAVQSSGDNNLLRSSQASWRSSASPSSSRPLERCRLPSKAGSCSAVIPSYYYDVETNTCNFFIYSGCFGNANRFSSLNACETECKEGGIGGRIGVAGLPWRQDRIASSTTGTGEEDDSDSSADSDSEPKSQDLSPSPRSRKPQAVPLPTPAEEAEEVCKLPPVQGPCRGQKLRFHWDHTTQQCFPFIYSGCRGNRNNFLSESDCLSACGKEPTIEELTSDGVLSCSFGNETIPIGATVAKSRHNSSPGTVQDQDCGIPICQCLTPPSVTCFQTSCPIPTIPGPPVCPTPTCGSNCVEAIGLDGCPTCDCDDTQSQVQIVEVFIPPEKL